MFAPGAIIAQKSHWQCIGQTLAGRSSEREFRRNLWITTLEEAGRLCKTIPQNGVKVAPLGAGASQSCPIDFQWCRTAHEMNRNRFSIEHNSGSQCHRDKGAGSFDSMTNQHLRIIVKLSSHAPSNHLEHLSNTSHRLPLKEIKGISQDRSVIETWGWARLTRGSKQPILNHLNTHWPRPSNHCRPP